MNNPARIFVINPGSTSTKIAVYENDKPIWMTGVHHSIAELATFKRVSDQYEYRKKFILEKLEEAGIELNFDAVIGRGGLLKPLHGGVYRSNEKMRHDLINAKQDHACNLGVLLADEIAQICHCPSFTADPGVVDERWPIAKLTGLPFIKRISIFHALNSKALAHKYAASIGKKYEDLNLIVSHMGGGISVGAHLKGSVVDVNNAFDGDGPFSPERAGTLPAAQLVDLCFSGKYTQEEIKKLISGKGGLMAYVGSNNMIDISLKAEQGEEPYKTAVEAMMYNIAKYIGSMYVTLRGKVDAIILTGGICFDDYCMGLLKPQIDYLAPIVMMPGENELESLAYNALGALKGTLPMQEYTGEGID